MVLMTFCLYEQSLELHAAVKPACFWIKKNIIHCFLLMNFLNCAVRLLNRLGCLYVISQPFKASFVQVKTWIFCLYMLSKFLLSSCFSLSSVDWRIGYLKSWHGLRASVQNYLEMLRDQYAPNKLQWPLLKVKLLLPLTGLLNVWTPRDIGWGLFV